MSWLRALAHVMIGFALLSGLATTPAGTPGSVEALLRNGLGFTDDDVRAVNRGRSVAKSIPSADHDDVAAAGVIRLRATPTFFVERMRDITRFKSGEAVLQIGTFSAAPRFEDLTALTWDGDDLNAFRTCRIANCDVRLTAPAIERLRGVDWASPRRDEQASQVAKRLLVETVIAYVRGGDGALQDYRDRDRPVSPQQEFRTVARESPSPLDLVPEFRDYLLRYPRSTLPHVESFLYWSKEKVAFHSVISVTHVAVYTPPAPSPFAVVIGSRQVYATRYFDASLGMTALFEPGASDDDGVPFDLLYLNRSRTDELGGFWGGFKRAIVRSRTRSAMHKYLALLKTRLEREFSQRALNP